MAGLGNHPLSGSECSLRVFVGPVRSWARTAEPTGINPHTYGLVGEDAAGSALRHDLLGKASIGYRAGGARWSSSVYLPPVRPVRASALARLGEESVEGVGMRLSSFSVLVGSS